MALVSAYIMKPGFSVGIVILPESVRNSWWDIVSPLVCGAEVQEPPPLRPLNKTYKVSVPEGFVERQIQIAFGGKEELWLFADWSVRKGYVLQIGPIVGARALTLAREIERALSDRGAHIDFPVPEGTRKDPHGRL
jgi:hypothetical protein